MTVSEPAPKHPYRLRFVRSAWTEWEALDGSVKEPLRKLLRKRLDNPHVPSAALHGELRGYYKIKLRKAGYRLVYGVEDDALIVMVIAVDRRADSLVYRSAIARLTHKVSEPSAAARRRVRERQGAG